MPLTDLQIHKEKPTDKPHKLSDGGGLYMLVNQASKYWRWKYRVQGKEKVMALGVYPEVSLAETREAHMAARKLLATGVDPVAGNRPTRSRRPSRTLPSNGGSTGRRVAPNVMPTPPSAA